MVVRYLVPEDDETMIKVSGILSSGAFVPGHPEMTLDGEELDRVEHFTDKDYVHRQPRAGFQVVKCRIFFKRTTADDMTT